jgi:hypothetical protein
VKPRSSRRARASSNGSPGSEEVARRAYEIYLSRNGAPGDPVSDWLTAEAELRQAK